MVHSLASFFVAVISDCALIINPGNPLDSGEAFGSEPASQHAGDCDGFALSNNLSESGR